MPEDTSLRSSPRRQLGRLRTQARDQAAKGQELGVSGQDRLAPQTL